MNSFETPSAIGTVGSLRQREKAELKQPAPADSIPAKRAKARKIPMGAAYGALLLFLLINFSRPEDWIPGLSHVPLEKITGILALLALVFSIQNMRERMPREVIFLGLLVAQFFIGSLVSPVWRGGAFQQTFTFAKVLLIVVVLVATVNTAKRLRLLILTQAISISAIAAVTILKGHEMNGRLAGVLDGNYADPNDLALAMVISLPMCMALFFLSRNIIWKSIWAISVLMMTAAIILTGSRGGFLALMIVVAACLWEFAVKGRHRYLLVLAVLAGVVFWQISSGSVLVGRLKGTFNVDDDTAAAYDSAQARQALLLQSLQVTLEHPLFGVGLGNFAEVSLDGHTTHNSFTLMSSEGGLPALILYVLILWCGFKNLRLTKRLARERTESGLLARCLFASLAGYVIGSVFLSVAYQFFTYILLAYTTVLFAIARKSSASVREVESARQPARNISLFANTPESKMSFRTS